MPRKAKKKSAPQQVFIETNIAAEPTEKKNDSCKINYGLSRKPEKINCATEPPNNNQLNPIASLFQCPLNITSSAVGNTEHHAVARNSNILQERIITNSPHDDDMPRLQPPTAVGFKLKQVYCDSQTSSARRKSEILRRGALIGETKRYVEELQKEQNRNTQCDILNEISAELEISLPAKMEFLVFELHYCPRNGQKGCLPIILRDTAQVARLIIYLGKQSISASPLSNKNVIVAFEKCTSSSRTLEFVKNEMKNSFATQLEQVTLKSNISAEISHFQLKEILEFTIYCRILDTGKWIHVGDNMKLLVNSRVTEPLPNSRKCVNAPVFSFCLEKIVLSKCSQPNLQIFFAYLRLYPSSYKILPAQVHDNQRAVYCLPRCAAQARLMEFCDDSSGPPELRSLQQYQKYWYLQHGYKLPVSAFRKFVKVSFSEKLSLIYPLGVLWREKMLKLPHLSKEVGYMIGIKAIQFIADVAIIAHSATKVVRHCIENYSLENKIVQRFVENPNLQNYTKSQTTPQLHSVPSDHSEKGGESELCSVSQISMSSLQAITTSLYCKPSSSTSYQKNMIEQAKSENIQVIEEATDLFEALRNSTQHNAPHRILPPPSLCEPANAIVGDHHFTFSVTNKILQTTPPVDDVHIKKSIEIPRRILPPPSTYNRIWRCFAEPASTWKSDTIENCVKELPDCQFQTIEATDNKYLVRNFTSIKEMSCGKSSREHLLSEANAKFFAPNLSPNRILSIANKMQGKEPKYDTTRKENLGAVAAPDEATLDTRGKTDTISQKKGLFLKRSTEAHASELKRLKRCKIHV